MGTADSCFQEVAHGELNHPDLGNVHIYIAQHSDNAGVWNKGKFAGVKLAISTDQAAARAVALSSKSCDIPPEANVCVLNISGVFIRPLQNDTIETIPHNPRAVVLGGGAQYSQAFYDMAVKACLLFLGIGQPPETFIEDKRRKLSAVKTQTPAPVSQQLGAQVNTAQLSVADICYQTTLLLKNGTPRAGRSKLPHEISCLN